MIERILGLEKRIADLERDRANMLRWGRVHSVDANAGTVGVRLPTGLVLPMRWAAVGSSVWAPPTVGEQCMVLSPSGRLGSGSLAICGVTKDPKGDKYVIGAGTTRAPAIAELVEGQLNQVIAALSAVSAGGGSFTGSNTYTTVGSVAATKTEVE